jgi:hypothetical protein
MAGTLVTDRIESDASYPSSINIASPVIVSNTFAFPAGTVSAPAFFPTGDTNTGIFFPAADTIAFTEGGAEAMRIDSSGNVGIGTTSPAQRLHIVSAGSTYLQVQNTANSITGFFVAQTADFYIGTFTNHPIAFYTNNTERMRINSSGNVGIGTSSPGARLDVVGSIKVSEQIFTNTQTGYGTIANAGTWTSSIAQGSGEFNITYLVSAIGATFPGGVRNVNGYTAIVGFANDGSGQAVIFATLNSNGITATASRSTDTLTMTFTNSSGNSMSSIRVNFLKLAING